MRESDIIHENGNYWVAKTRDGYAVFRNGLTHAISTGVLYANDADGRSIAIASCDYKADRDRKAAAKNGMGDALAIPARRIGKTEATRRIRGDRR